MSDRTVWLAVFALMFVCWAAFAFGVVLAG